MQKQFPIIDQLIHLNHAAVGPWPAKTTQVVKAFADENAQQGSLHYKRWMVVERQLRSALANLINAPSADDMALVKSTSEGLSFVAYGLSWKAGDNIVGILQEFPSNRFVWESLHKQGVEFRKLDLQTVQDPEQGLFDLCDHNTRLISVSAVQYHNGLRMDLARIGNFCRERGILFCVDGIQQIGAMPFDVQSIGADFVIADGHKWMLSAEGLGLFYVRAEVLDRLSIMQYGWHMADNLQDYSQQAFSLAKTVRRFECGSPNMLGIHALNSSVGLLLEQGMRNIGGKVIDNSLYLMEQLEAIQGIRIISDSSEKRLSGIVTFSSDTCSDENLYKSLSNQGVLCVPRGGGIRLSPHFYTPREQLEQVVDMVQEVSDK